MLKFLFSLILFIPSSLLACPACAGGDVGSVSKTPYTVIILGCFIVLTYIPFYLLFRAAKKYAPENSSSDHHDHR